MQAEKSSRYTLGLDIGIASIGWCLLGDDHIINLGVRCFDKGETEKGESLAANRRTQRLMRRRLRRRQHRLLRLSRLFKHEQLLTKNDFDATGYLKPSPTSPWQLRAEGLDRLLQPEEWARVLYHLVKNRGFYVVRKSEVSDDKEGGKLLKGVKHTRELIQNKNYRTAGEMAWNESAPDKALSGHIRNKQGDYQHSFAREILKDELERLFESQASYKNSHTSPGFKEKVLGLFWQQRPPLPAESLLKMLGKCTFEPTEYRAPKYSYSAERFVWLTKLNNLRIYENGKTRSLSPEELKIAIDLPYQLSKLTYKQLRKKLDLPDAARFTVLRYDSGKNVDKDPEDSTLMIMKGYHELSKTLRDAGLKTEWESIATRPDLLNEIARILSICKTDSEIRQHIEPLKLQDSVVEALLSISFDKFINLSIKAIDKILPFMVQGLRYDEACQQAGYDHYKQNQDASSKHVLLPPIDKDDIRNPVVIRALSETRKVINAIIRQYGSPYFVHIEMARDLSRNLKERQKIEKLQKENREAREKDIAAFVEQFGFEPKAKNQDLFKWRLFRLQHSQCAYSQRPLELDRLFEPGYAEVDHILPHSRSFDDGFANKVVVLTAENRQKANQTPFEYLSGSSESERWQRFSAWVGATKSLGEGRKQRLLRRDFSKGVSEEFREKHLTDTRYMSRYLKNWLESTLAFPVGDEKQRVHVRNGALTAFLRSRWGLNKNREESDRHHAQDAAVIAAASQRMVHALARYSQANELQDIRTHNLIDIDSGEVLDIAKLRELEKKFPTPWPHFRHELQARMSDNPQERLKQLESFADKSVEHIKPIFISRPPRKRISGQAHQETIRSSKQLSEQQSSIKTPLTKLNLNNLENMLGKHRDTALYAALKKRLEEFGGNGEKAFIQPFYKPRKDGEQGPLVRSIPLLDTQKSGLMVRGGIANNGDMVRVDIFTDGKKYYAVPIYVSDTVKKELPNKAVVAGKIEDEWTIMTESYSFMFSLHSLDLFEIQLSEKIHFGYFAGLDRATAAVSYWVHDKDNTKGKDGLMRSIGIKTAKKLAKYVVDPLGNYLRIKQEVRVPFKRK